MNRTVRFLILSLITLVVACSSPEAVIELGIPALSTQAVADPSYVENTVFTAGESGYSYFHQVAVAKANDGTVLAFAQGRIDPPSSADASFLDVVLKRSTDNGVTWGPIQILWDDNNRTQKWGNVTPLVDTSTGKIFAFTEVPAGQALYYRTSVDNGATWSGQTQIPFSIFAGTGRSAHSNSPSRGIRLASGRLLLPIQNRNVVTIASGFIESDFVLSMLYSDDGGSTWQNGNITSGGNPQGSEVSVTQLSDGRVYLNARNGIRNSGTTADDYRIEAYSSDGGISWSPLVLEEGLIDPPIHTASSVISPSNTTVPRIIFMGPNSTGGRNNMTGWISYDAGESWIQGPQFTTGGSQNSDLLAFSDGTLGALWGKGRLPGTEFPQTVVFSKFNLEWLTFGRDNLDRTSPPNLERYEAEWGQVNKAKTVNRINASNGRFVASIDEVDSYVEFTNVQAPIAGSYILTVQYANGLASATHNVSVNGNSPTTISYPNTGGWAPNWGQAQVNVNLNQGSNTVRFTKGNNFAELDYFRLNVYEAEFEQVNGDARVATNVGASNGQLIATIDNPGDGVEFTNVNVASSGTYQLTIRYANGLAAATHNLSINGGSPITVNYPSTGGWVPNWDTVTVNVNLVAGDNTLLFSKGSNFAELDWIKVGN